MITKKIFLVLLVVFFPILANAIVVNGINYNIINGEYAEVVKNSEEKYSGDIVIPESVIYEGNTYPVRTIGVYAFYQCTGLKSITIPNSVTSIGNEAFYYCTGLTSVTIPNSVTYIGDHSFSHCFGLTSVIIPNSVNTIGNNVFFACSGLTTIDIPYSVISIGNDAFCRCSGLTTISIPNSVTTIGDGAFMDCSSLTTITIPYSVTTIGKSAFDERTKLIVNRIIDIATWCNKADPIASSYPNAELHLFKDIETEIKDLIIPNDVPSIRSGAFKNCKSIITATIPSSITNMDDNVFYDCSGLTAVYLPNSVKEIGNYTFYGCRKLTSITIPNSVTTIGNGAFFGTGLMSITIPNGVTSIGYSAFRNCYSLTSISIYSSAVNIGNNAFDDTDLTSVSFHCKEIGSWFSGFSNLKDVMIGDEVTSIGNSAFSGCSSLMSITIPNSVTTIGQRAFANIGKLNDVTCYAMEVPTTDRTAFENSYIDYVTLHVLKGAVEKYKSVGPWKNFREIMAIEGTCPSCDEKCSVPEISFNNNSLIFECATDGALFHYNIEIDDAKKGVGNELALTAIYQISVYASKEGYDDSEVKTAMLYWINVDPITTGAIDEGLMVNTNAILVQNAGGRISVSGFGVGTDITLYDKSGVMIGKAKSSGLNVMIETTLSKGDICIMKIGDRSVKYILK